jgi:hypothetical protein
VTGAPPAGTGASTAFARQPASFAIVDLASRRFSVVVGTAPSLSGDGRTLAYIARTNGESSLMIGPTTGEQSAVKRTLERLDAPALSADGGRVAFQQIVRDDWEIFVADRDGGNEQPVTHEIQHDLLPRFIGPDRLLAVMGEPRHRRSYLYDLMPTGSASDARPEMIGSRPDVNPQVIGSRPDVNPQVIGSRPDVNPQVTRSQIPRPQRVRLFHNNTVRTIAPEYQWSPSPDGTQILIGAERDGNTVSPDRGVYAVDLTRKVTRTALLARLRANLRDETALKATSTRAFEPIAVQDQRTHQPSLALTWRASAWQAETDGGHGIHM